MDRANSSLYRLIWGELVADARVQKRKANLERVSRAKIAQDRNRETVKKEVEKPKRTIKRHKLLRRGRGGR